MTRTLLVLGSFCTVLFLILFGRSMEPEVVVPQPSSETHAAVFMATTTESIDMPSTHPATSSEIIFEADDPGQAPQQKPQQMPSEDAPQPPANSTDVVRLKQPYNTPALSTETLNSVARSAVVNILCIAAGNEFQPVSASGIVIGDGVILTNAHVAQYVLLQDYSPIDLTCLVRNGSPAQVIGQAHVAFISDTWLQAHAPNIISENQTGTGENDVALLTVALRESTSPRPLPLPTDSREAVAFESDAVIIASYPAGFLGGLTIERSLALVSTIASIGKLYSFQGNTIDMFSVGGTIVAQGGSSGSPVVNDHGYVVGMITTSSEGATTDARDLRALTTSHIDRVLRQEMGMSLSAAVLNAPEYARTHTKNLAAQAGILTAIIFK